MQTRIYKKTAIKKPTAWFGMQWRGETDDRHFSIVWSPIKAVLLLIFIWIKKTSTIGGTNRTVGPSSRRIGFSQAVPYRLRLLDAFTSLFGDQALEMFVMRILWSVGNLFTASRWWTTFRRAETSLIGELFRLIWRRWLELGVQILCGKFFNLLSASCERLAALSLSQHNLLSNRLNIHLSI
jgi:hypothetical protein